MSGPGTCAASAPTVVRAEEMTPGQELVEEALHCYPVLNDPQGGGQACHIKYMKRISTAKNLNRRPSWHHATPTV